MTRIGTIAQGLPSAWLVKYVETFESGRVQKHPHARFVNAAGECCLVGALAGARASADVVASSLYAGFQGGPLEELSRAFEARRVTGQSFYEEALLALAARAAAGAPARRAPAAGVRSEVSACAGTLA